MKKITGPVPRHRYHRDCNCLPCFKLRTVLMHPTAPPDPPPMPEVQLEGLLRTCREHGTLHSGDFPSMETLKRAQDEGRLFARDLGRTGIIHITDEDACHITFTVD